MSDRQRIVRFEHGHDCIRFECCNGSPDCAPGKGGSHGIHGLAIRFVVKDKEGAVQFLLYTGWLPQHVQRDHIGYYSIRNWGSDHGFDPMPADLGYHSKVPHYEGQTSIDDTCEFCDGQPCYYDGSGLNASQAMYALVNGGDEALWRFLDSHYDAVFHGADYPSPAEYPMPLRGAA